MARISAYSGEKALPGTARSWLAGLFADPAAAYRPPFGPWRRLSASPVISPRGNGFESAGTFNPAVVETTQRMVMLYRAQDRHGASSLGYAVSRDGIHFTRRSEPVLWPQAPYEKGGGVEDPRIVQFGGAY